MFPEQPPLVAALAALSSQRPSSSSKPRERQARGRANEAATIQGGHRRTSRPMTAVSGATA
eukprot:4502890-Alexandrium_andersonii.AAC.1